MNVLNTFENGSIDRLVVECIKNRQISRNLKR